ncbi:hypothetical protein [Granulicella mallensis]|uniref:hypothetical protein n=1 Tax=Granulicella mallensis TaxID=940614 RepID=UPI0002ECD834|nr:hypothetical protein [Granulicella mallensis]
MLVPAPAKDRDVAVPTVLFIGLGALVVLLAPWRDLGLIPILIDLAQQKQGGE